MRFPKNAEAEVMGILTTSDDDQIVASLIALRTAILFNAVKPLDKALFTNDLLTLEVLYRGLKL